MIRGSSLLLSAAPFAIGRSPIPIPPCPHVMHTHSAVSGAHHVTLSRVKALNSLSYEMINTIAAIYKSIRLQAEEGGKVLESSTLARDGEGTHQHVPSIPPTAVLIKGAGGKAFCAGGDIVGLCAGLQQRREANVPLSSPQGRSVDLFYTVYQTNYNMMHYPIPLVAFLDGIVMGAGVGVSVHGSHRLVSEKATFAMPETAIGLFPDVGGTWFLPRVQQDGLGLFLGLTGCRLKGADLVHAGIGTHYVPSELMPKVEEALMHEAGLRTAADKKAMVSSIVSGVVGGASGADFSLGQHLDKIQACFGVHVASVEEVLARLQADGGEWAMKQHKALLGFSPTSLKLSFVLFRAGARLTCPKEMFKLEYRAIQHCVHNDEFMRGVTALLIDKTGKPPVWAPSTLEGVTQAAVDAYMGPTSHGVEWDPVKPFPASQ